MAIEGENEDSVQNRSSQVISGQSQGIDYNHPLFLNPTDVSGMGIISFQLIGVENTLWSRSMKIALLGRNKMGLIDETARKKMFGKEIWG